MLIDKIKELGFLFTDKVPTGSSFLFPNGEFLDIYSSVTVGFDKMRYPKISGHYQIEELLKREGFVKPTIKNVLAHTDNVVKLQDAKIFQCERYYIVLPPVELTPIQYQKLEDWLYGLSKQRKTLDIANFNDDFYQVYDIYDEETGVGYTPEDIIKEIKRLYSRWHY